MNNILKINISTELNDNRPAFRPVAQRKAEKNTPAKADVSFLFYFDSESEPPEPEPPVGLSPLSSCLSSFFMSLVAALLALVSSSNC